MSKPVKEFKAFGFGGKAFGVAKRTVGRNLRFKLRYNCHYEQEDFLLPLLYLSVKTEFPEGGLNNLNFFGAGLPDPDTLLYQLEKFKELDIRKAFRKILNYNYRMAVKNGAFRKKVVVAFDYHKIPYYGKRRDEKVVGAKKKLGTCWAHCYATSTVVVKGERFTLDARPVSQFSRMANVVKSLLFTTKSKVKIALVLLDRGFVGIDVIEVLKAAKILFLMPAIMHKKMEGLVKDFELGKLEAISDYILKSGKNETTVKLVMAWSKEEGKVIPFFTNAFLGPEEVETILETYGQRWGIETGYRMAHEFRPMTCSNEYVARLAFFLLSICMYNIWILCNLLLGKKINGKIPEEPLFTAKFMRLTFLFLILKAVGIELGG